MKKHHNKRKTGYQPTPYKVGESGLQEAEELVGGAREILNKAQLVISQLLDDCLDERQLVDWETRDSVLKAAADNGRAVAAIFREERTADRFAQLKAEDMTPERAVAIIVEAFRRLPADLKAVVARQLLGIWDVSSETVPEKPASPPEPRPALQLVPPKADDEG